jgi:chromosome partitioning protein
MKNLDAYSIQRIINIFGADIHRDTLAKAEKLGQVPLAGRLQTGSLRARRWSIAQLPEIGERFGFVPKLQSPQAIAVFSMKGGVLKTTLSLNIARLAALHNMRVCVVGLDTQGDITKTLFNEPEPNEHEDLAAVLEKSRRLLGLSDVLREEVSIFDTIRPTDLPTLHIIPETAGLARLDIELTPRNRREYWLTENVIDPLKKRFDLIVLDCAPSWSQVIGNALVACDMMVSPLETKINHFRNYEDFTTFIASFERSMGQEIKKVFVPTKYQTGRKLSSDIRAWYIQNVPGCTATVIREAVVGEEAMSAGKSLPEYAPTSSAANDMRDLMIEIWSKLPTISKERPAADQVAA